MQTHRSDIKTRVTARLQAWLALTQRRQLRRVRLWDPTFEIHPSFAEGGAEGRAKGRAEGRGKLYEHCQEH